MHLGCFRTDEKSFPCVVCPIPYSISSPRAARDVQAHHTEGVNMRTWWRRKSAVVGLLAAIFSDLRRRAWWAYRHGSSDGYRPTVGVTARRRVEHTTYVPTLSASWQSVAAHALPVLEAEVIMTDEGTPQPTILVDITARPDVSDTPRVLRQERTATGGHVVVGTQWLADLDHDRILLVVTFIEPVASTWALSFDVPRTLAALQQIAARSDISVVWTQADRPGAESTTLSDGIHLTVTRSSQLKAILGAWTERQGAHSS